MISNFTKIKKNMAQYMIEIALPKDFDEEFVGRIPEQREMVDRLMAEGVVMSYTLSGERTMLWVVMNAKNQAEVKNILFTFPLIGWMNYQIIPLMFHFQNIPIPALSLN
jgi:muconolactone delta-isomerase